MNGFIGPSGNSDDFLLRFCKSIILRKSETLKVQKFTSLTVQIHLRRRHHAFTASSWYNAVAVRGDGVPRHCMSNSSCFPSNWVK